MTTVSSGAILLVGAVVDRIGGARESRWLVTTSIVGFLACVLSATACLTGFRFVYGRSPQRGISDRTAGNLAATLMTAWAGFASGIFSIAVYTLRNW
jgi:uncharacterized membrane protein YfcA